MTAKEEARLRGKREAFLEAASELRDRADGYRHGRGHEGQAALMGAARWLDSQAAAIAAKLPPVKDDG